MTRGLVRALLLTGILGIPGVVRAQDMDVPVEAQIPLLYKILPFDRNFEARAGDAVMIGIVYQKNYRASALTRDQIEDIFKKGEVTIVGRPLRWIAVALEETDDLAGLLRRNGVDVIYVTPLRGPGLQRIMQASRDGHMLTFTGVSPYVERGLSVGIGLDRERPQILVNLASSRNEGSDFTAQLLRVSRIVGDSR